MSMFQKEIEKIIKELEMGKCMSEDCPNKKCKEKSFCGEWEHSDYHIDRAIFDLEDLAIKLRDKSKIK